MNITQRLELRRSSAATARPGKRREDIPWADEWDEDES